MGSQQQQQEGSGLDSRKDRNKQKDNSLHSLSLLGVRDGAWDGALSPQPEFSTPRQSERERERWKGMTEIKAESESWILETEIYRLTEMQRCETGSAVRSRA